MEETLVLHTEAQNPENSDWTRAKNSGEDVRRSLDVLDLEVGGSSV